MAIVMVNTDNLIINFFIENGVFDIKHTNIDGLSVQKEINGIPLLLRGFLLVGC